MLDFFTIELSHADYDYLHIHKYVYVNNNNVLYKVTFMDETGVYFVWRVTYTPKGREIRKFAFTTTCVFEN